MKLTIRPFVLHLVYTRVVAERDEASDELHILFNG